MEGDQNGGGRAHCITPDPGGAAPLVDDSGGESAAALEGTAPTQSLRQSRVLLPPRAGESFSKVKPGQRRQGGTQNRMKLYLWTFLVSGQGSQHFKKQNQAKAAKPSDSEMTEQLF